MPIETPVGFQDATTTESFLTQASATNLGGFLINQDYAQEIEDFRRKETVFWQLIQNKVPAPAPIVKKIRKNAFLNVGFVPRSNINATNTPANTPVTNQPDLSDPGQEVKAIAGTLEFEHFARSMQLQQNRPYEDTIAEETADLMTSLYRFLDMQLYSGNANAPGNLQFNGLEYLIPATGNVFTASRMGATPQSVATKIDEVVTRAATDRNVLKKVTHIFCTGAGALQIRKEVGDNRYYTNQTEITAGIQVPSVITSVGTLPIVTSPYLNDIDGGAGNDTIRYWLVDMDTIEWNGVFPFGGENSYEPQIFDISTTINGLYLVEKRMILMYGTPYAKNSGQGIFRLDLEVPTNSIWQTA